MVQKNSGEFNGKSTDTTEVHNHHFESKDHKIFCKPLLNNGNKLLWNDLDICRFVDLTSCKAVITMRAKSTPR